MSLANNQGILYVNYIIPSKSDGIKLQNVRPEIWKEDFTCEELKIWFKRDQNIGFDAI